MSTGCGGGEKAGSQKNLGGGWVCISMPGEEEKGELCTAASPEVTRAKDPQQLGTELMWQMGDRMDNSSREGFSLLVVSRH